MPSTERTSTASIPTSSRLTSSAFHLLGESTAATDSGVLISNSVEDNNSLEDGNRLDPAKFKLFSSNLGSTESSSGNKIPKNKDSTSSTNKPTVESIHELASSTASASIAELSVDSVPTHSSTAESSSALTLMSALPSMLSSSTTRPTSASTFRSPISMIITRKSNLTTHRPMNFGSSSFSTNEPHRRKPPVKFTPKPVNQSFHSHPPAIVISTSSVLTAGQQISNKQTATTATMQTSDSMLSHSFSSSIEQQQPQTTPAVQEQQSMSTSIINELTQRPIHSSLSSTQTNVTAFAESTQRPNLQVTQLVSSHTRPDSDLVQSSALTVVDESSSLSASSPWPSLPTTVMHNNLVVSYKPGRTSPHATKTPFSNSINKTSAGPMRPSSESKRPPVTTPLPLSTSSYDFGVTKPMESIHSLQPTKHPKPPSRFPAKTPFYQQIVASVLKQPASLLSPYNSTDAKKPPVVIIKAPPPSVFPPSGPPRRVGVFNPKPASSGFVNAILAPPMPSMPFSTAQPSTISRNPFLQIIGADSLNQLWAAVQTFGVFGVLRSLLFTLFVVFMPPLSIAAAIASLF